MAIQKHIIMRDSTQMKTLRRSINNALRNQALISQGRRHATPDCFPDDDDDSSNQNENVQEAEETFTCYPPITTNTKSTSNN